MVVWRSSAIVVLGSGRCQDSARGCYCLFNLAGIDGYVDAEAREAQ
jgi:hypothetical protein